jgi:hypothetical protein
VNVEQMLEDRILGELVDGFANKTDGVYIGARWFRLAYLEETPGVDDDALVLIEPVTGELYEVEVIGVHVRRIEPAPKEEPESSPVDPDQLPLLEVS